MSKLLQIFISLLLVINLYGCKPQIEGTISYISKPSKDQINQVFMDFNNQESIQKVENILEESSIIYFDSKQSKWLQNEILLEKKTTPINIPISKYIYHKYDLEIIAITSILNYKFYENVNSLKNFNLEHTNNKKVILDFNCKEILLKVNNLTYSIYYTKEIPYPIGPSLFIGLEGAVLYVYDLKNKKVLFEAISYNIGSLDKRFKNRPNVQNMIHQRKMDSILALLIH